MFFSALFYTVKGYICIYMYVCKRYVCIYVFMYVCITYVYVYIHTYTYIQVVPQWFVIIKCTVRNRCMFLSLFWVISLGETPGN